MNETATIDLLSLVLPAAAALLCLGAAAALASLVRLNKGAKLNRAWVLVGAVYGRALYRDLLK
jgi:hypothetical protein